MDLLSDVGVTALCLGTSAYLYLLHYRRTSQNSQTTLPAPGYVLTNQVTHARLLPTESKHAFTYPTLSLLLSVSALESGALNRGWRGIMFGYPGLGRICGLRPRMYLRDYSGDPNTSPRSIRQRLVELLRPCGIHLGEVWIMTMPSFLGFEGINPLTVYFCYEEGHDRVWGVILEVHNTFGERHAYVLQIGKGEDGEDKRLKGYDHQWTFPRQFHVSPFNDRSGHYVCSVVMPSHPPPLINSGNSRVTPPRPIVNLHLLTAPPASQLKLTALLRAVVSEPLTARSLLAALILPPFSSSTQATQDLSPAPSPASWAALPLGAALLLTAIRIVYHAGRLHYQRGLAVFARPEPTAGVGREWVEKALGGVWNDVQPSDGNQIAGEDGKIGGGIGWQAESPTERWARETFKKRFGDVATRLDVRIQMASADPSVPIAMLGSTPNRSERKLVVCYRSPRAWTGMLLAPTAEYALGLASQTEKWFTTSDDQLFIDLWNAARPPKQTLSWQSRLGESVRSQLARMPDSTLGSIPLSAPPYPPHPLDSSSSFGLVFHLDASSFRAWRRTVEGVGSDRT
ncbi:hypothetical protein RhiJN_00238 [Ceratobasidium sp. AG-Ba]|nr:hypothetical protein RhiJN_00238 [Ceratobasidium sp. AG-Ba]